MKTNRRYLIAPMVQLLVLSLTYPSVTLAEPLKFSLSGDKKIKVQKQELSLILEASRKLAKDERPPVVIELILPTKALPSQLSDVRLGAKETYKLLDTSHGLQVNNDKGRGWTFWKGRTNHPDEIRLHIRNDVDDKRQPLQGSGEYGALTNNGTVNISLPTAVLTESTMPLAVFDVSVRAGGSETELEGNDTERATVTIDFDAQGGKSTAPMTLPDVRIDIAWTGGATSKAIELGDAVEIQFRIEQAVSGMIIGPMARGQSFYQLPEPKKGVISGSVSVRALGHANYTLKAEVKPAGLKGTVQVFRSVSVDVRSFDEYANIALIPPAVLPGGHVDIHWATWGLGDKEALKLLWTDHQDYRQVAALEDIESARGTRCFIPSSTRAASNVSISNKSGTDAVVRHFDVRRWQTRGGADWIEGGSNTAADVSSWLKNVRGAPTGLAVSEEALMVSTTEGLWRMELSAQQLDPFAPLTEVSGLPGKKIKGWLGVVVSKGQFVGLCRCSAKNEGFETANNELALIRFPSQGGRLAGANLPTSLSGYSYFQLLDVNGRIYVIASNGPDSKGSSDRASGEAFSIDLDEAERGVPSVEEPLLSNQSLRGDWSMVAAGDSIYALNRSNDPKFADDRGRLLVFGASGKKDKVSGTLLFPRVAALREFIQEDETSLKGGPPLDKQGNSLVTSGVLVNVGGVLVLFGAREGERFEEGHSAHGGEGCPMAGMSRDLAYNPQTNSWSSCGHGLNIDRNTLIAYLNGPQPRLWAIRSQKEAFTLAVDGLHLFSADYLKGNPTASVEYFGEQKSIKIQNNLEEELSLGWEPNTPVGISLSGNSSDKPRVPARGNAELKVNFRKDQALTITLYGDRGKGAAVTPIAVLNYAPGGPWLVSAVNVSNQLLSSSAGGGDIAINPP